MIRTARLYLVGLFLIGVLSAAAGTNWMRQGEIVFRSEDAAGKETVARIDRGDPFVFVPMTLAWLYLGSGVAALSVLSPFLREKAVERWAVYGGIALIFLAVATSLASYNEAKAERESASPADTRR